MGTSQSLNRKVENIDDKNNQNIKNNQNNINKKNNKNYKSNKKNIKIRRGNGGSKQPKSLVIFSTNAAGLNNKMDSLKSELIATEATIFTIQETHYKIEGNLKVEGFEVFEAIRKTKEKGGTAIGVKKDMDPVLIEEYSDNFELLIVEVKVANKEIRIISGYGPQEITPEIQRRQFFTVLEAEIKKAEMLGKLVFIEMDANSKLGPSIIPNDPHQQTANGKILADVIERNALTVGNALENKCRGTITRKRSTEKVEEQSVIDIVLMSNDLEDNVEAIIIDEERKNVLTKIVKTKKGLKKTESDHNVIITKFKLHCSHKKKTSQRQEFFNFKDAEGLKKFKEITTNTTYLSEVFKEDEDIKVQTKIFLKRLGTIIRKCFTKFRVIQGGKKYTEIDRLFNERRTLKGMTDEEAKEQLGRVEEKLAALLAERNVKLIKDATEGLTCEEGGINSGKLWQLKRHLHRKHETNKPTALLDSKGELVTTKTDIEDLIVKTYEERLKARAIRPELRKHQEDQETLCHIRMENALSKITPDWTKADLVKVLNHLKKDKSRDPLGLANEIFKPEVAGDDLQIAVVKMMNMIKDQQIFPECLILCNITNLYKLKGTRKDLNNYRGIFRVTILRGILDRLIYNDSYETIDSNLSDVNVGARKNRNIRDNIFVANAAQNSVRNRKEIALDFQLFDVEKCFDPLWPEECYNDIYDNGLNNDKLPLIKLGNTNVKAAIKTSEGRTDYFIISKAIMQGTVWGSLMCTSRVDKLSKLFYNKEDTFYKYRGQIPVPPLGMVDDILSIQKPENAKQANIIINKFIELKKLTLSEKKCSRIKIGKNVPTEEMKVHDYNMKESNKEKYIGDIIASNGKIDDTINQRQAKGFGIIADILSILDDIPLGKYKVEIGLLLREAMLINGLLYNSEAWHNVSKKNIVKLMKVDEALLRGILKAHSKTPLEFLYLETGSVPIDWVIKSRRINYLQNILRRDKMS